MEIREALTIIKNALGSKGKDKRTKEYQALKAIEEKLFPPDEITADDIERIINEVMLEFEPQPEENIKIC
ncbi:MAG: hypothetical protein IJH65_03900 [Methanobrevibacter sp.]|nr:hypothetical protein [Methanobrevibacter sp.]